MAETYNNKYGDNIVKRELEQEQNQEQTQEQEQEQETQMNHIIQQGGANNALKNYSKQAKLIGGRIKQSQLDFFTSHVKSSKIVKSHPKRRSKRRKL